MNAEIDRAREVVVDFDAATVKAIANSRIVYNGAQYQAFVDDFVAGWGDVPRVSTVAAAGCVKLKEWSLGMFKMPLMTTEYVFYKPRKVRSQLRFYQKANASCSFDIPVYVPVLWKGCKPWMSLTPNEIVTLRGSIRAARGRVIVMGLGMGYLVDCILQRPQVKSVTVVERDADILKFFSKNIQQRHQARGQAELKPLTFVCEDAWQVPNVISDFDVSLWDIWAGYGDAKHNSRYQAFKKQAAAAGHRTHGWGDVHVP